ncbi:MAG: antitoxin family protein [Abditibacteriales bacterium]|nr:antitoxin family protein [Abditibacteriales bacterium]MDW8365538.1 antitoxin family protein [Abditibacteriales bacterium]
MQQFRVTAVYENGVFRPLSDVFLKGSQEVELIVTVFKPIETEEERQARIERGLKAVEDFKAKSPIEPKILKRLALDPQFSVLNIPLAATYGIETDELDDEPVRTEYAAESDSLRGASDD